MKMMMKLQKWCDDKMWYPCDLLNSNFLSKQNKIVVSKICGTFIMFCVVIVFVLCMWCCE